MIAAGGAGDREVRYVIRIAADPGNAAVVARETATLRAFEQRVASVGASAGNVFVNRFGDGGVGPSSAEVAYRARRGAAVGTAAHGFQRLSAMGRERFADSQQEAAGRAAWAAGLANLVRESERQTVSQAKLAGAATGKAWRAGFFGELAHIAGQRSTIEMFTGQNVLGRGAAAMVQAGGRAIGGSGLAIGGIAAMGALSLGATKALVDPVGTSEAVGGWGIWGADKYASLMNWFGRFSPEGRLAEERGEYIADYFGNRKTAFLAQRSKAQERFRTARDLWSNRDLDLAGQRRQVEFEAALARGRVTGDFSGVQALSRSDMSAARRQLDGASGDAIGPAAKEYVSALERESQLIRDNASARETLSQKMGDEIARMQQLQANRGSIAERYLRADPAERSLLNRAAAGDLATLSDRELLQAGNLGYNSPAYLAEAERRAKAQGLSTPQLDARIDAARSAAETFKQQLETGLGRSLGPLNEAFAKAGEAIGEIVAKEIAKNMEAMVEAVQKANDASAAKNVNRGQAMLRRSQQVGLS